MKHFTLLLACTPLANHALAQDVTFLGKVEDVSGTTNQFVVDCTNTTLTSGTFNLNAFVDAQVEITGTWNGSSTSPAVDVTSIETALENFEIGGGAKIGELSNLSFVGAPGDEALGFVSTSSTFAPFGGGGVVFLGTGNIVFQTSGTIGGTGQIQLPMPIPNNTALIGLDIFGQGALIGSNGSITLTNPDCKTLSD